MIQTMSYTQARNNFRAAMDKVWDDRAPLLITRQNERPVVMLSLDDYNALDETAYLLSSPKNRERLLEAKEQTRLGNYKEYDIDLSDVD